MTDGVPGSGGLRTSLYAQHVGLRAKLVDFGGWQMPVEYGGGGVLEEHAAVRDRVGLFDVSHLGTLSVRGPGAAALVDASLTNSLGRIGAGRAQYTLCCDEHSGGVVDDLIVYLHSDDDLVLVPNAANSAEVARRLAGAAGDGVRIENLHADVAILAVQGPRSDDVLRAVGLPAGHPYMSFLTAGRHGHGVTVCRTGYTGERGYELMLPAAEAPALWDALLEAVRAVGGLPCGLGARDTLRTEMGYPLHGHELSLDVTPVQARLGWAVGWKKPAFWGRDVLLAERERGPDRVLRGLVALGRGVPRDGMAVRDAGGAPVGVTTSGTFSPTLRQGIALALLDPAVADGAELDVDVRGRAVRCRVQAPPFVQVKPGD
jgi:aminomethyltransferase